jgi:hypothetical protein
MKQVLDHEWFADRNLLGVWSDGGPKQFKIRQSQRGFATNPECDGAVETFEANGSERWRRLGGGSHS